jgi:phospholipid/cholesterol/gamma-HCH transport system substrate-binding protein
VTSFLDTIRRAPRPLLLTLAGLLVIGAVVVLVGGGNDKRTVTAHFSRAVSVFPGSEVRILGVPVGTVTAVVPEGATVRVEMEYDSEYDVPKDAQAVIVTPTLTADRFVQLSPAYTSGPKLADGAQIAVQDTGTPIELDRIYRSLADVTKALGPNGVNKNGTLDNVLGAGAKMLKGQGARANRTIVDMSKAVKVFGDGSGELFGTVRALDEFTGALAANDATVSQFMGNLGEVSQQLAGEKDELSAALANLAAILGKVERFVKGNRGMLVADVKDLTTIVKTMGDEKDALEAILDIGPSAMGNLVVAFDPKTGSIGSRLGIKGNVQDLDGLLCQLVRAGQPGSAKAACALFQALLEPVLTQAGSNIKAPARPAPSGTRAVRYGDARPATDLRELMGGGA